MRRLMFLVILVAVLFLGSMANAIECFDSCCCSNPSPCYSYCRIYCSSVDQSVSDQARRAYDDCLQREKQKKGEEKQKDQTNK